MKKIIILAGSNNNNLKLSNAVLDEVLKQGASGEVIDLTTLKLPVYTATEEKNGIPAEIKQYVEKLSQADAMVAIAPEYNGGIPPVVTNFISWISRAGSEDWRACFNGKKIALGTHSGSGGMQLLNAMRMQFSYLGMIVVGRQLLTHYQKELNPDSLKEVVGHLLK